jgi:protoheme IX farnesyltransferase
MTVVRVVQASVEVGLNPRWGTIPMEAQVAASNSIRPGFDTSPARSVRLYLDLAKARLATLVVLTAVAGYVLGADGEIRFGTLVWTVIGTALTAFGANILNQVVEMDRDRLMERTRRRPLPSGQVTRTRAAVWGLASAAVGLAVLVAGTNLLTAALALTIILLYLLAYTPLKVRTSLNTVVGAVCGALPPVMGWTAATGEVSGGAWILFGVLFLWQIPHFLALDWIYRSDYARGGFRMLSAVDSSGVLTGRVALVYSLALLPVCAGAVWMGLSGGVFLVVSCLLGVGFSALAWQLMRHRTSRAARRLFLASLLYLPIVLGAMVADAPPRAASSDLVVHNTTTL